MINAPAPETIGNQLLAKLPAKELQQILPYLREVSLQRDDVLYDTGQSIEYIYFPISAALSALTIMDEGAIIQVGSIGKEGASGVSMLLGAPISIHHVICQIPGQALRINSEQLQRELLSDAALRSRLFSYHTCFLAQVSQSAACNGLHPVVKRCCRWLLMTHDRVGSDDIPLTHEFLSFMLGVRRASVTAALQALQNQGVISTSRGSITMVDRQGLEALSCQCYRDVKRIYERLLGRA